MNITISSRESFEVLDFESTQDLKQVLDTLETEKPELLQKLIQEAKLITLSTRSNAWVEIQKLDQVREAAQYTISIGKSPLPNQHRLHKHGTFDYRFEARQCKTEVFVRFTHPTIDQFINDAVTCAGIAAIGSVIAAATTGAIPAAYAIFYPAWKACMILKVGATVVADFNVELFTKSSCGCWENHC